MPPQTSRPIRPRAKVGDAPSSSTSGRRKARSRARAGHGGSCSPRPALRPRGLGPAASPRGCLGARGRFCGVACLLQRTKATQYRSRLRESSDARRPLPQRLVAGKLPSIRTSGAVGNDPLGLQGWSGGRGQRQGPHVALLSPVALGGNVAPSLPPRVQSPRKRGICLQASAPCPCSSLLPPPDSHPPPQVTHCVSQPRLTPSPARPPQQVTPGLLNLRTWGANVRG